MHFYVFNESQASQSASQPASQPVGRLGWTAGFVGIHVGRDVKL